VRVIVNARGPRLTEKLRPVLFLTFAAVDTARLYSGALLVLMPPTRTLLPLVSASTLTRNFVFGFIRLALLN